MIEIKYFVIITSCIYLFTFILFYLYFNEYICVYKQLHISASHGWLINLRPFNSHSMNIYHLFIF